MSNAATAPEECRPSRTLVWAGIALGVGLGGFFDGILLHQVLQWHHLLSGIEAARQDIRMLILWDGVFHGLMYIVTALGLWLLWRSRRAFSAPGADCRLWATALIGFGCWHVADAVLSHWTLGIHRVRMDVDNPLFWDLLWLAAFGVAPVILGWLLLRGSGRGVGMRMASSPIALVMAVLVGGPLAALPPAEQSQVAVVFWPGTTPQQALGAIMGAGSRLVDTDPAGNIWVVDLGTTGSAADLYRHGAMLVSASPLPAGCFNWLKA